MPYFVETEGDNDDRCLAKTGEILADQIGSPFNGALQADRANPGAQLQIDPTLRRFLEQALIDQWRAGRPLDLVQHRVRREFIDITVDPVRPLFDGTDNTLTQYILATIEKMLFYISCKTRSNTEKCVLIFDCNFGLCSTSAN